MAHDNMTPSDWVRRWTPLIPRDGQVLDLACGHGRHLRWLASANCLLEIPEEVSALANGDAVMVWDMS